MDHAPGTPAVAPAPSPGRAGGVLRFALGAGFFVALGFVGRVTIIDTDALSLTWPAAGVAALWFASGNRTTWSADAVALGAASLVVNLTTGASLTAASAFTVSNLLQVAVFVALVRRWLHHVWGLGGREPLHRLADLGRLAVASSAGSFVGAATGALGLWLTGTAVEGGGLLVWWGRNAVSIVALTTFGLIVGPPLFAARTPRDVPRILYAAVRPRSGRRLVEAALLVATSVGLYGTLFVRRDAHPLSFLVLAVTVWAGLRFSPVAVVLHGAVAAIAGLAFTVAGTGPFADIASPHTRALVAQMFILTTALTGLALVFSRTERDQATQRLAQARREADERARLLSAVLESMNEGVVVIEEGGRVVLSNSATETLLALDEPHDQLRPASTYHLFHRDGTPLVDGDLPGLRDPGDRVIPPEDLHLRVDSVPEGRVLEISGGPLARQRPDDRPLTMVNIRDVTLDRQHRDALASFAGVVAHDLFNPLTVVTGWAESLEDEFAQGAVAPSVGLPMVERLHDAASHMRHVIGDLLAYTVARDQSLRPGPVDLSAEVATLAALRAESPDAPTVRVAPDMSVWADPGLVRQLFDNLLGNAVKYVAQGVHPRVDVRARTDGVWAEIRVTDNGIGIPEDQREAVFETFHRVQREGYQGTGLGLAICRRIVERHGGSIHAEPGPDGHGTTMVVRLPATSAGYHDSDDPRRLDVAGAGLPGPA